MYWLSYVQELVWTWKLLSRNKKLQSILITAHYKWEVNNDGRLLLYIFFFILLFYFIFLNFFLHVWMNFIYEPQTKRVNHHMLNLLVYSHVYFEWSMNVDEVDRYQIWHYVFYNHKFHEKWSNIVQIQLVNFLNLLTRTFALFEDMLTIFSTFKKKKKYCIWWCEHNFFGFSVLLICACCFGTIPILFFLCHKVQTSKYKTQDEWNQIRCWKLKCHGIHLFNDIEWT